MKNLEISCYIGSEDFELFKNIVNQGIDARLEAFTNSTFKVNESKRRLYMEIDTNEISLFMRRLSEAANKENCTIDNGSIDQWEDDILDIYFDIDPT